MFLWRVSGRDNIYIYIYLLNERIIFIRKHENIFIKMISKIEKWVNFQDYVFKRVFINQITILKDHMCLLSTFSSIHSSALSKVGVVIGHS